MLQIQSSSHIIQVPGPTENLRHELEPRTRKTSISSEDNIKHWLNEELKNVDTDYLKKINCNISQRSRNVMQNVGHSTKYWISLELEAKVNFLQWPEANLALKLDVVLFKMQTTTINTTFEANINTSVI